MNQDRVRLQTELTGLKTHLGRNVALRKTRDGPDSPFPISIDINIDKPKQYDNYDVDRMDIRVTICEVGGAFNCVVDVKNENLPKLLRESISQRLKDFLISNKKTQSAPIGLLSLCSFLNDSFGSLLCLRKELLEPYEVADPATGRSIRRVAILNNDSSIQIDASVPDGSSRKATEENVMPDCLEKECKYLSKVFGNDFRCIPAKKSYIKTQTSDKTILDFLHENLGIGMDLKYPALQHARFHVTVTMLPTAQSWSEIVPVKDGDARLVIHIYVGDSFPDKGSVICRIQFADEGLFPDEYSPIVLGFEKILLYRALSGAGDRICIKDMVKYCMNHADEAMVEAVQIWEEAQEKKKKKEKQAEVTEPEPTSSKRYVTSLQGLQMDDVDAMTLHSSSIDVACVRCRSRSVIQHNNLVLRWNHVDKRCSSCDQPISVSVQVRIVHGSSNILCILACTGCIPMDILPCTSLEVQCQCSDTSLIKDQFHLCRWNEKNCRVCHTREAYRFDRVVFDEVKQTSETSLKRLQGIIQAASLERALPTIYDHDAPLTHGQPLPDTGTCVHYHHSHRWLRFPCCGRRYPCDLCHEEMTDGHEMKWANRMVCGFCSLEQRVDSRCSGCSKKLTSSSSRPEGKNTCFWEGGTGQRNKKRLSKKDPHKFRNSKSKTVSKKAAAKNAKR